MNGAADLLVEQDLLGEFRDVEIRAKSELAKKARAVIDVELLEEQSSPFSADALTTLPFSNSSWMPVTSRPA